MIHRFYPVPAFIIVAIVLVACASSAGDAATQPSSSDQVATVVAATMQALTPEVLDTPATVPEASESLLPRSLYFLGTDGQAITQVYRMERDGKTVTQLTSEAVNVADYDVSSVDGTIAYVANNQLLLTNANGSNRRMLVDAGLFRYENNPTFFKDPLTDPVFSPDGQTIAYARFAGVYLYDVSTGVSNLVLESQYMVRLVNGVEQPLALEIYTPARYSLDGAKLLIRLHYSDTSSAAIYYPADNELIRLNGEAPALDCCGFTSVFEWSADSSSVYVANPRPGQYGGGMWRVDAVTGAVTTIIPSYVEDDVTANHLDEPYLAPDGQLYFFFSSYSGDLGPLHRPPVELTLLRSAPDGVTDRTVLSKENLRLMNEALWAPEANLVVVVIAPSEEVYVGGQAEIIYFDGRPNVVLTTSARSMKWGP